jgi:uncharacterized protein
MTTESAPIVESPCVKTCIVDPGSRLCVGCLRTIDEITAWSRMTPEERQAVMAALPTRASRLEPGASREVRTRAAGMRP